MPIELFQAPPQDFAQGIMHVKYLLNDRLVNIQRIHLDTSTDDAVLTAFTAYAAIVKKFFSSDWTIQLSALDKVVDFANPITGLTERRAVAAPTPATDDVPGESTTASTAITGLTQTIFVFDTLPEAADAGAQKFRLRFVGKAGSLPGLTKTISPSGGGTADEIDLVTLLTDATKHYRAHNGEVPLSPARVHTPLDARERHRMMRKK